MKHWFGSEDRPVGWGRFAKATPAAVCVLQTAPMLRQYSLERMYLASAGNTLHWGCTEIVASEEG